MREREIIKNIKNTTKIDRGGEVTADDARLKKEEMRW